MDLRSSSGLRAWWADRQGGRGEGRASAGGAGAGRATRSRAGASSGRRLLPAERRQMPVAETAKGQVTYEELSKLQSTIARRMAESKATAPHFYLRGRDRHEPGGRGAGAGEGGGRRRARSCPRSTTWSSRPARWRCASIRGPTAPTATGASSSTRGSTSASRSRPSDALVVPTVFDADRKGLRQIADRVAGAGRAGPRRQITPPELSGAHLHRLQPGDVRDRQLRRGDQPAAGGDPRGRRDQERPVVRDGEIATAHLMRRQPRLRPPHPLRRPRRRVPRPGPDAARRAALAGALSAASTL